MEVNDVWKNQCFSVGNADEKCLYLGEISKIDESVDAICWGIGELFLCQFKFKYIQN